MDGTSSGGGHHSGRHWQTYNTRVQSKVRSLANLAAASATCQPAAAARRSQGYTERGTTSGHTLVLPGPGLYTTSGHSRLGMLTLNIHRQHSALALARALGYFAPHAARHTGATGLVAPLGRWLCGVGASIERFFARQGRCRACKARSWHVSLRTADDKHLRRLP